MPTSPPPPNAESDLGGQKQTGWAHLLQHRARRPPSLLSQHLKPQILLYVPEFSLGPHCCVCVRLLSVQPVCCEQGVRLALGGPASRFEHDARDGLLWLLAFGVVCCPVCDPPLNARCTTPQLGISQFSVLNLLFFCLDFGLSSQSVFRLL